MTDFNERTNRRVWQIVALLFVGWCIIWIFRTLTGAVHPEIMEVVGPQSSVRMGLISSCYFVGYVAMQIPGGFLMDRFGKQRILIPSFALMALGFLLVGLARSIEMIYAGSVLAGVGSGTYYSGAFSLSTENVPGESKYFATAIVNSGGAFGMLMGYLYASALVKQLNMDWRAMIFFIAILAIAMIPVIRLNLKDDGKNPVPARKKPERRAAPRELAAVLFSPRMISSYFFYFCTCYGYYMIVSWLPSFLQNERGLSGVLAGYASSVIALVSIPGALFLGKIMDKFSRRRVQFLTGIQILSGLLLVCVTSFRPVGLIVLSLALYGVMGKQAVDPLIVPCVTEQFGDIALSTGLGVFNFFGMSASVIGPLVNGFLQDTQGSQIVGFYIAAALLAGSSLIFRFVHRNGK